VYCSMNTGLNILLKNIQYFSSFSFYDKLKQNSTLKRILFGRTQNWSICVGVENLLTTKALYYWFEQITNNISTYRKGVERTFKIVCQ